MTILLQPCSERAFIRKLAYANRCAVQRFHSECSA